MTENNGKIVIIGAQRIGPLCAWSLAMHGIGSQILLIDANRPRMAAQTTDLSDTAMLQEKSVQILSGSYEDCGDAQVALVCVENFEKTHFSKEECFTKTVSFLTQVAQELKASGFSGVTVLVCNHNDVMARYFQEASGFPANTIIGGEALLWNARLQRLLGEAFGVRQELVEVQTLGESGESQAVIWSAARVSGKPMLQLMSEDPKTLGRIDLCAVAGRSRRLGNVIQDGKGHEEFGMTSAACAIIRAVLEDRHALLPVSVSLNGVYGQTDIYAVAPAVIGCSGVEKVLEMKLEIGEQAEFLASCRALRDLYQEIRVGIEKAE